MVLLLIVFPASGVKVWKSLISKAEGALHRFVRARGDARMRGRRVNPEKNAGRIFANWYVRVRGERLCQRVLVRSTTYIEASFYLDIMTSLHGGVYGRDQMLRRGLDIYLSLSLIRRLCARFETTQEQHGKGDGSIYDNGIKN
jgi:hypothetical protein